VYRMSSGSILLMCLLCFILGGQDRLPWAPVPSPAANSAVIAEAASVPFRPPSAEEGQRVRIAAANARPPLPSGAGLMKAAAAGTPAKSDAAAHLSCATGFALVLPSASGKVSLSEWLVTEGESVTVRYAFVAGGQVTLTQSLVDPASSGEETGVASNETITKLSVPTIALAQTTQTLSLVWKDPEREFVLQARGVNESAVREWMRSFALREAGCPSL
jgi:hypothetical protein